MSSQDFCGANVSKQNGDSLSSQTSIGQDAQNGMM